MIRWLPIFGDVDQLKYEEAALRDAQRAYPKDYPVEMLVRYLQSGHSLFDWMGMETCVLDASHGPILGTATVTDGTWIWRADTSHYVEQHGVRLCSEFLQHVAENEFRVPEVTEEQLRVLRDEARAHDLGQMI